MSGSVAEGKEMKDMSTAQVWPSSVPSVAEPLFSKAQQALLEQARDIVELWKKTKAAAPGKPGIKRPVVAPKK